MEKEREIFEKNIAEFLDTARNKWYIISVMKKKLSASHLPAIESGQVNRLKLAQFACLGAGNLCPLFLII